MNVTNITIFENLQNDMYFLINYDINDIKGTSAYAVLHKETGEVSMITTQADEKTLQELLHYTRNHPKFKLFARCAAWE
jgi:hypothetical protein